MLWTLYCCGICALPNMHTLHMCAGLKRHRSSTYKLIQRLKADYSTLTMFIALVMSTNEVWVYSLNNSQQFSTGKRERKRKRKRGNRKGRQRSITLLSVDRNSILRLMVTTRSHWPIMTVPHDSWVYAQAYWSQEVNLCQNKATVYSTGTIWECYMASWKLSWHPGVFIWWWISVYISR